MRTSITLVAVVAGAMAASGCLGGGGASDRNAPDEFRVVTRAPLTLPPDYSLRPPRPGEPRPQEGTASDEARAALFGTDVGQTASAGERALVSAAGAEAVDPNVRATVDFEGGNIVRRNANTANQAAGAPDTRTPEQRAADEENARRATGGGAVRIERREGETPRLPGT